MSAIIEILPFPRLSLPKRVILTNPKLNLIYYASHLPIIFYGALLFFVNMQYTDVIPNNPFTLISVDQTDMSPFMTYEEDEDDERIQDFCNNQADLDCSLEAREAAATEAACRELFGAFMDTPISPTVSFSCAIICNPQQNSISNTRCFRPPGLLLPQGSQLAEFVLAKTTGGISLGTGTGTGTGGGSGTGTGTPSGTGGGSGSGFGSGSGSGTGFGGSGSGSGAASGDGSGSAGGSGTEGSGSGGPSTGTGSGGTGSGTASGTGVPSTGGGAGGSGGGSSTASGTGGASTGGGAGGSGGGSGTASGTGGASTGGGAGGSGGGSGTASGTGGASTGGGAGGSGGGSGTASGTGGASTGGGAGGSGGGSGTASGTGGASTGGGAGGSGRLLQESMAVSSQHVTYPMMRDAQLSFTYSFKLAQPAPFLFGFHDRGERQTNNQAVTAIVDSLDIVIGLFQPGQSINLTASEMVEAAGANWNFTMVYYGSELIAVTNCYTSSFDLADLFWADYQVHQPTVETPLCLLSFSWLQHTSVTFSAEAGIERVVKLRLMAEPGSSFHRLPSVQVTLLNLISLLVLLGIPPSFAGFLARSCLGPLSRIYRRATQEYFDLSDQVASAGLKMIASGTSFASTSNFASEMTREELRQCLKEVLTSARMEFQNKDLDRLANFIYEEDHRVSRRPKKRRTLPKKKAADSGVSAVISDAQDDPDEPRMDAARFAVSMASRDPINIEDMRVLFDSERARGFMERVFTPNSMIQAMRRQPQAEIPAWKRRLLGLSAEMQEEDILGKRGKTPPPKASVIEEPRQEEALASSADDAPSRLDTAQLAALMERRAADEAAISELAHRMELLEEELEGRSEPQSARAGDDQRLDALERRNRQLQSENEVLQQGVAELREQQAQLASRCDRQLATMEELTQVLRGLAPTGSEEASALPASCFSEPSSSSKFAAQRRL